MRTSDDGQELIKCSEGLRLKAYRCPAGVLTIGWGHTGRDVYAGMSITEQEALDLLRRDMRVAETIVTAACGELTQNKFDALVSLVFNIGSEAFWRSTIRRKVVADPDDPSIADEFRRWVYAGKKRLQGLADRREKEIQLYFKH